MEIENTIISDKDENKLIDQHGGEYAILMRTNGDEVPDKTSFLDAMKEYVFYFAGKEESEYVKEDHLKPIINAPQDNESGDEQNTKPKENQDEESKSSDTDDTNGNTVNESSNRGVNNIITLLFEDENGEFSLLNEENDTKNNPSDDKRDGKSEDAGKIVGYQSNYGISIKGEKSGDIKSSIGKRTKGLWGALWADLKNFKIDINGKPTNIGAAFDPDTWRQMMGKPKINIETAPSHISNAFKSRYPNTDVRVMTWKTDELLRFLNKSGRLTPSIKSKLSPNEYAITIKVSSDDINYNIFNEKLVARICSDTFGTSNRLLDGNSISYKDVIKLDYMGDGLNDRYEWQITRTKTKDKDNFTDNDRKTKSNVKESEDFVIYESIAPSIECDILMELFESKRNKKKKFYKDNVSNNKNDNEKTEDTNELSSNQNNNNSKSHTDLYIVTSKNFVKRDRNNKEDVDSDGTVTMSKNETPHKATD